MTLLPYDLAIASSARTFQGAPCRHGHAGERYTRKDKACVLCQRIKDAARQADKAQWRHDNRDKLRAYNKARNADPARKAAERKRKAQWKRDNAAIVLERRREYEARNPHKVQQWQESSRRAKREREANCPMRIAAQYDKAQALAEKRAARLAERERKAAERAEWLAGRPERKVAYYRAKAAARRAIKRNTGDIVHPRALAIIWGLQDGGCAYCGDSDNLHIDHILAVTKGGKHEPRNLQFLCAFHNISKGNRNESDYRAKHNIPALTPWDVRMGILRIALDP